MPHSTDRERKEKRELWTYVSMALYDPMFFYATALFNDVCVVFKEHNKNRNQERRRDEAENERGTKSYIVWVLNFLCCFVLFFLVRLSVNDVIKCQIFLRSSTMLEGCVKYYGCFQLISHWTLWNVFLQICFFGFKL